MKWDPLLKHKSKLKKIIRMLPIMFFTKNAQTIQLCQKWLQELKAEENSLNDIA